MKWYMQMPTWDTGNVSLTVSACGQKRFDKSRRAPASGWLPRWGQRPTAGLWLSTSGREAEEVLSEALKITQHGMVKKRSMSQCGSLHSSPSVRLSLSHHRSFDFKKNKESNNFITKCYDSIFHHFSSSWVYNNQSCQKFQVLPGDAGKSQCLTRINWKVKIPSSSSSSSSCHATSTDILDPLSPLLPIVHRLWQVFRATSRILT